MGRISYLRKIIPGMNIQLVTPAPLRLNNGNKITALRWAQILKRLGHRVRITQTYDGKPCDLLIALHARRSADSIRTFRDAHPQSPLIVALTGTDLYRDIRTNGKAQQSLKLADRLIVLQKMALQELPRALQAKTQVIYQSAEPLETPAAAKRKRFHVCVIAHLRAEKDPLRAAMAVRHLPRESRIEVVHIGLALDDRLATKALSETARNPRYRWLGALPHRRTRQLLAQSDLACITSKMEGSSNVLSEALASGVPVLATKIPGLIGTLGEKFPGYFPVGGTEQLRDLLRRAEINDKFYRSLKQHCAGVAKFIQPKRELNAWQRLLKELDY
ncbi:MAG TPA: selenoneine biosynthesis selenosugar synthase SenB [Terriglobales bacterium]|nr:selenoneine biosynthesis selenosugar synthase SenB [Terriglobales bacterium]